MCISCGAGSSALTAANDKGVGKLEPAEVCHAEVWATVSFAVNLNASRTGADKCNNKSLFVHLSSDMRFDKRLLYGHLKATSIVF